MQRNTDRRLGRLEAVAAGRASADAELIEGALTLLAYEGDEPSTVRRRARVGELFDQARQRKASAGVRRTRTSGGD